MKEGDNASSKAEVVVGDDRDGDDDESSKAVVVVGDRNEGEDANNNNENELGVISRVDEFSSAADDDASSSSSVAPMTTTTTTAPSSSSSHTATIASSSSSSGEPIIMLNLVTRTGRRTTLPAVDAVKSDDLAMLLVERVGTPGAYQAVLPGALAARARQEQEQRLQEGGDGVTSASPPADDGRAPSSSSNEEEAAGGASSFVGALSLRHGGENKDAPDPRHAVMTNAAEMPFCGAAHNENDNDDARNGDDADTGGVHDGSATAVQTSEHNSNDEPSQQGEHHAMALPLDAYVVPPSDDEGAHTDHPNNERRRRRRRSLESIEDGDDDELWTESFRAEIRDRLVRNAPLIDGALIQTIDDDDGIHDVDEERGVVVEGAAAVVESARGKRGANVDRSSSTFSSSDERGLGSQTRMKRICPPWRSSSHRHGVLLISALVAVACVALIVGLSVSLRESDDTTTAQSPPAGDAPAKENPPSAPPAERTTSTMPSWEPSVTPTGQPTARPTAQPTTERFLQLKEVVKTVSTEDDLNDATSPQYRALAWLAYEDVLNVTTTTGTTGSIEYYEDTDKLIQRYVAATYYFSTTIVDSSDSSSRAKVVGKHSHHGGGGGGTSHGGHGHGAPDANDDDDYPLHEIMVGDECHWNRPEDKNSWGLPKGLSCDGSGRIVSINFGSYYRPILGRFPEETGHLLHLRHLIVFDNPDITGTVPHSVAHLRELERVFIGHFGDGFGGGTIPPLTAPNLRQILFGIATFQGTIPSTFGNLTQLVTLVVASTDVTGTVPEFISDLKDLAVLNMANNGLTGTIPSTLGQNQKDLALVNFGNNNMIHGTIPDGLLESVNLRGLFLYQNHLTGTVGSEFGRMADLRVLNLHSNALSSTIPPELGNGTSFEYLELGDNRLNGTVPASLGRLLHLESISLEGNSGLRGDLNFLCDKSIANFLSDCAASNPYLVCRCCECCHESTHTCGQHHNTLTLWQSSVRSECCIAKQCGKLDHCTGRNVTTS